MRHIKGYAPYGIPIYDDSTYVNKFSILKPIGDQSVEFVKRWYMHAYRAYIPHMYRAIDIFTVLHTQRPFTYIANTEEQIPCIGDILVWKQAGMYKTSGHVAIVIKVLDSSSVIVAEQNTSARNGIRTVNPHSSAILGWIRV